MKLITLCCIFIAFQVKAAAQVAFLDELKWQNRIVLIDSVEIHKQAKLLRQESDEVDERHIIWIVTDGTSIDSNSPQSLPVELPGQLSGVFKQARAPVLLVGKDGGLKLTQQALNIKAVFFAIDGMPMRRQEIKVRTGV